MNLEEELQALQAEKDALLNKNKELLSELKTARNKNKEIDSDAYYKTLDELDSLKSENSKLSNELNKKSKDFDGLSKALEEKENYLRGMTLENALNDNLSKIGVKTEYMEAVRALMKQNAKVEDNNVLIGDKSIGDYISSWANESGKAFISAPANSGSGANGGQGGQTTQKLSDLTESERIALFKSDPTKFNQMKQGL